jgi:hypothetical protein
MTLRRHELREPGGRPRRRPGRGRTAFAVGLGAALAILGGGAPAAAQEKEVPPPAPAADSIRAGAEPAAPPPGVPAEEMPAADEARAAAAEPATAPPAERPAIPPRERSPGTRFPTPGDTLHASREAVERTGAHTPIDLLGLIAGGAANEAGSAAPFGAFAQGGSFAAPEVAVEGFPLRLPRLEGIDLGAMALDRVGPSLELLPMGSAGPLAVADRWTLGPGSLAIAARPAETAVDSARSRFSGQTGAADLGAATLLFADQRGPFTYSINVENAVSDHSGSLSDMNTRLSILGLGVRTGFGRVTLGIRGAESNQRFLDGRRMHRFNQGFLAGAVAGDSAGPEWSLQLHGRDDRLSGSELANVELKRKGLALAAMRHARPGSPFWARLAAEHDWFAIRHAGGVLAPRVARLAGAVGVQHPFAAGPLRATADLRGVWQASDRHSPVAGGAGMLTFPLPRDLELELGGGRGHIEPTFDQEVLVPGSPVAEPETHDHGMVQLKREGPLAFGVRGVRRNLDHVPQVTSVSQDRPWPEFTFATTESRHWELGGTMEATFAAVGIVAGADAYRLIELDSGPGLLPFVPEAVARAHLKWQGDLFGGDLVLMPRADLVWMGERVDFQRLPIESHARLDLTLVMVFGRDIDLEFRIRNVTNERYALAVVDPASGALGIDSGRLGFFTLRWRFLN